MLTIWKPRPKSPPPARINSPRAVWAKLHSGPGYRTLLVGLLVEAAGADAWSIDDYATFRALLEQAVSRVSMEAVARWAAANDLAPNLYAWTHDDVAEGDGLGRDL